ncbi:MAG: HAD-IA family hydrolase [Granulosicoccus sp.]
MKFDTIVFDLGGVLIEAGDFPIKMEWQRDPNDVKLNLAYWVASETGRDYEKGLLSTSDFANKFIREANLNVSSEEFIDAFRKWPIGPFPGVHHFLRDLRQNYTVALFSNVNELHWDRIMNEMDMKNRFDHYFASHIIQRAKPDVTSFDFVANEMNVANERIIFLDDNAANVAGAKLAGFSAHQVKGFDEAKAKLENLGIN